MFVLEGAFTPFRIASDTSVEAALEPVKLLECIGEGSGDFSSRFAVQPLCLDYWDTIGRIPQRAFEVPDGLGVIMGLFRPAASLPATVSARSRMSFMITVGFASTRC
jgi:hypothetical protein